MPAFFCRFFNLCFFWNQIQGNEKGSPKAPFNISNQLFSAGDPDRTLSPLYGHKVLPLIAQ